MKISVKLEGSEELRKAFEKELGKKLLMQQEVYRSAHELQTQAKDNVRGLRALDTGNLRNSIIVEMTADKSSAEIGPTAPYGIYVEFGTRHTSKMPPPEALEDWARKHGFESAWPICKAILKRGGLPARPFLSPAYFSIEPEFIERLKKILEEKSE
jgi:HK97 gp10 family phage protein